MENQGSLTIDGDSFTVSCEHKTYVTTRTNDPQMLETEEVMIRTALQRHSSYCQLPCMIGEWNEWFRRLRARCEEDAARRAMGAVGR